VSQSSLLAGGRALFALYDADARTVLADRSSFAIENRHIAGFDG
jgi:hypothetical protein